MTHTSTAPLSDLPRIIRENLKNCREHDVANATLVLSREMLEELDGLIGRDGGAVSQDVIEIPDDIRIPLHSFQADLGYLLERHKDPDDEMTVHCRMSELLGQIETAVLKLVNYGASLRAPQQVLPQPMEWQSAVGDGRMNNDWQLYVDGSLRRYIENRFEILERRIAELEKT